LNVKNALLCSDQRYETERRLYRRNRNVLFLPGDLCSEKSIDAIIAGIRENGALILRDSSGKIVESASGEIAF